MLLESYTTEGMTMAEYHKWAEAVWDVVEFDARNRWVARWSFILAATDRHDP